MTFHCAFEPRRRFTFLLLFLAPMITACTSANTPSTLRPALRNLSPGATEISSGWKLIDAAVLPASTAGPVISRAGFNAANWHPATVPGTVLTSLVNDGVYPEPLYGENNRPNKIPESLSRTSYWYRTEWTIPADYTGKKIWLNFTGTNYIAEVWVNGQQAGTIRGAFARGIFDVTSIVSPGRPAAIAVHILPPPNPGVTHEKTFAKGTGPNGGILSGDGPTFLCTLGWDWIPTIRDRDMGIWQSVFLSSSGPVVIQDPLVTSTIPLPRTDEADLNASITVANVTDSPVTGVLNGQFSAGKFEIPVTLAARETRLISLTPATAPDLHVLNPKLWWPNGYGPQNLDEFHFSFTIAGAVSDSRVVSFGIRQISYELPGSDNLAISINGVPVMCKGGCWGMDEAMKRIPRDRLEAQIRYHQLANYNMIRNWVGQSTSDDFYDLCDRYGIMIWDEFFQPNKSDGPNPPAAIIPMYLDNVREKVLRYRNHPSIVVWCGRNESDPAPQAVDDGIVAIMKELEPSRHYQRSSTDGKGVKSGGPYEWRTPREYFRSPEIFKTELGSVSIPTIESIHASMPPADWETVNDDWATHDLCWGAQGGRRTRDSLTYPKIIQSRYGHLANLADFVRKSQLANYEAYKAMYEGRQNKMFKPNTGVLTWMSNPSQPSFVWQIYSYDLDAHSSLFAVRNACEPIHIQLNQDNFHVMVINNTPDQLLGFSANIRIFNLDGTQQYQRRLDVGSAASTADDIFTLERAQGLSAVHFVKLELRDALSKLVSENFYWLGYPTAAQQDDLTALNLLAPVTLKAQLTPHGDSSTARFTLTLINPSTTVALMTHAQLHRGDNGQRVLPTYYSDNYVSLLPGEIREIEIEASASAAGSAPRVLLDGFNLADVSASPATVAMNAEAQVQTYPQRGFLAGAATAPTTRPASAPTPTP